MVTRPPHQDLGAVLPQTDRCDTSRTLRASS
jgi:hypothetical protein